jgi:ribosome-associated protein
MSPMVRINEYLEIPDDELSYQFARAGGPGGQNVNKVNTRAQLYFDVANSPTLTQWQRETITRKLCNRMDKDGVLRVDASDHRSQLDNRRAALERFAQLLSIALTVEKIRRKTRVPLAAKRRRLDDKHKHSLKKKDRTWRP